MIKIFHILGEEFSVTRDELLDTRRRKASIALARQVGMWICRDMGDSFECAARVFNRQDHSTAIHACEKVQRKMADPYFKARVDWCRAAMDRSWTDLEPWKSALNEWKRDLPQVIEGHDPHMPTYRRLHMQAML